MNRPDYWLTNWKLLLLIFSGLILLNLVTGVEWQPKKEAAITGAAPVR